MGAGEAVCARGGVGIRSRRPGALHHQNGQGRTNQQIYLDYLRNDRGSTSIAPFSPRARAGVPVAMTLDWKELDSANRPHFM